MQVWKDVWDNSQMAFVTEENCISPPFADDTTDKVCKNATYGITVRIVLSRMSKERINANSNLI